MHLFNAGTVVTERAVGQTKPGELFGIAWRVGVATNLQLWKRVEPRPAEQHRFLLCLVDHDGKIAPDVDEQFYCGNRWGLDARFLWLEPDMQSRVEAVMAIDAAALLTLHTEINTWTHEMIEREKHDANI